MKITDTGIDIQ